ncbi:hypothetical protein [Methanocalculus sp. MC3]
MVHADAIAEALMKKENIALKAYRDVKWIYPALEGFESENRECAAGIRAHKDWRLETRTEERRRSVIGTVPEGFLEERWRRL